MWMFVGYSYHYGEKIKKSKFYENVHKALKDNKEAMDLLGEPIKKKARLGLFEDGKQVMEFAEDIIGSKNKGKLFFTAEKQGFNAESEPLTVILNLKELKKTVYIKSQS